MPAATLRGFTAAKRHGLERVAGRLEIASSRRLERRRDRIQQMGERLDASLARITASTRRAIAVQGERLTDLARRLDAAPARAITNRREALLRLDRTRLTLGYTETLKRGFAVVHGPDGLITSAEAAARTPRFEIEFADGRTPARPDTPPKAPKTTAKPQQKSLF